jgi:putative methyltransferase (TIGR04325 family)
MAWAGVYARLEDVPARGGFEDDYWIRATRERTQDAMERPPGTGDFVPLVTIAGSLARDHAPIRILDLGGGMGVAYLELRRSLGPDAPIQHVVVELPRVAEAGRALYPGDRRISFVSDLPTGGFEIVHACGVLQYASEPFDLLRRLLGYGAPFVVMSNLPAGRIPRYATAQLNMTGSVVPCWMFDLDELEGAVRDLGYVVRSRSWSEMSLIHTYRTRDIPAAHRPERMVSLLLTPP